MITTTVKLELKSISVINAITAEWFPYDHSDP